jgi:hypothetical protein
MRDHIAFVASTGSTQAGRLGIAVHHHASSFFLPHALASVLKDGPKGPGRR